MATIYEGDDIKVNADKLVSHVIESFDAAKDARSEWETKKEDSHKAYHGILPPKSRPWIGCSNLHVPLTGIITDTYHANLMASFFNSPDLVRANPVSADDIRTATKREQFLNYQINSECTLNSGGLRPVADKIFGISLKYGDAIAELKYERIVRKTTKKIINIVPNAAGQPETVTSEVPVEEVEFDGVLVDVPNIDDIFLAPGAVGLQAQDCEFIIRRIRVSKAQYEDLVRNSDYAKINFTEFGDKGSDWLRRDIRGLDEKVLGISPELHDTRNYITLVEFHGEWHNEKTDKVQEIVAIVHPDSQTLCKAFINPLGARPFIRFAPLPVENQTYGQSIPEKLKYLQAELNTIHNQRRDSESKRICMPGFYDPTSDFDPNHYVLEPNGMYPVRGGANSVYFPPFQDAPSSLFSEEAGVFRYAEQLTGASEPMQGMQMSGETTATEFAGVLGRSSVRFELVFKRYEQSFRELIQMISLLDKYFMPEQKEFRIVGSDGRFKWESIKQQEMDGKLDLVIMGKSIANEQREIQYAVQKYQMAIGNPLIISNPAALYENTKEVFEKLGTKDIDRKLPVPPQAKTRTPVEEHELLYRGQMVYPDPREDSQLHLAEHLGETSQPEYAQMIPQEVQSMFMAHMEMTRALLAAQKAMQQAGSMGNVGPTQAQTSNTTPAVQQGTGAANTAEETKPLPQENRPEQQQA